MRDGSKGEFCTHGTFAGEASSGFNDSIPPVEKMGGYQGNMADFCTPRLGSVVRMRGKRASGA